MKKDAEEGAPEYGHHRHPEPAMEDGPTPSLLPVFPSFPPRRLPQPPEIPVFDEDANRFIQELQTYRIELEMQNEELRCAHEALLVSRDRFFHLFHRSPVGYLVLDEAGMIVDANETFLRMVGGGGIHAGKRAFADLLSEPDRRVFLGRYRSFFRDPAGGVMEMALKTGDGSRIFVRLRGGILDTSPSDPLEKRHPRLLLTVSDATDQKRLEELRTAELLLAQAIERTDDIRDVLRICTEAAVSISGMDFGGFYVLNQDDGTLELVFHVGLPESFVRECACFGPKSPEARFVTDGIPVYGRYDDAPAPLCHQASRDGLLGFAMVPVRHGNQVIGCLNIASRTMEEIPPLYRSALEKIAGRMGQAIARQRAEAALRDSEERFRRIFESAAVGICRMTPDGRFSHVNGRFCRILGYDESELLGKNFRDVTHPDDLSLSETWTGRALSGTINDFCIEKRWWKKDGTAVWGVLHFSAVRDADGKMLYAVAVVEDVTERKRMEAERDLLAQAIEHAEDMVVITDTNGIIRYVNPAFEKVSGYAREEAIGQNPRILQNGGHDEAFYRDMWHTLLAGKTWSGRLVNRRKDGSSYTENATITPVFSPSGAIVNYVAVKRDITREIQLEEQLRQAQKMEAVGRLSGGVAHDFNNLLSLILGYGEMLLEEVEEGHPHREWIDAIHEAGVRGQNLTRQLLAFSRKQVLEMKVVDVNAVIAGFEKMLRRLIGEDVSLELRRASGEIRILADVGQMEQVLMNLAVNARDAMPDGGVLTIETSRVEADEAYVSTLPGLGPGTYARIRMMDTGHGMDQETRNHLFEPFFTTKGLHGTGLGLSTVYGIIQQHGGHIAVSGDPGQGATFAIHLSLAGEIFPEPSPLFCQREPSQGEAVILLVEDDVAVRGMARNILTNRGYHVLSPETPEAAVSLAREYAGPIHLLLTDVVMPGMNGPEVYRRIAEVHSETGVLYMSGYTQQVMDRQGILGEGMHFLQKPLTVPLLLEKVVMALRGNP